MQICGEAHYRPCSFNPALHLKIKNAKYCDTDKESTTIPDGELVHLLVYTEYTNGPYYGNSDNMARIMQLSTVTPKSTEFWV
jgi:hypothetical protein